MALMPKIRQMVSVTLGISKPTFSPGELIFLANCPKTKQLVADRLFLFLLVLIAQHTWPLPEFD
ncbi:hypothetical protein [Nitrosospira sp. Nsp2]|uniref:hypothetical protein n=1 Tax=Nitrosospira sp. Nsp2 TaxID=136548 RepID=UPI0011B25125|nr:hypothetical protein [Nitrosospira sp. Nsp2]